MVRRLSLACYLGDGGEKGGTRVSRWWGGGRREAREAAEQEAVRRDRLVVDRSVEQARRYPYTHIQRWRCLEPLAGVSDDVIADVAIPMIRSGDKAEVILGVQLLDPATFVGVTSPQRQTELAGLLDELCRPDSDPDVVAAALGVWSDGNSLADTRLAQLLAHPSPTVRARAAFLYALQQSPPAPQRLIQLAALLDHDSDATVREQVADGLQSMLRDAQFGDLDGNSAPDPQLASEVVDCLRRHRHDPAPAVRALVFATLASTDTEPDLEWLLQELADPNVHPGFVSAVPASTADRQAPTEKTTAIAAALQRLHDSRWAERVPEGDYPGPDERRQALDTAIETVNHSR